MDAPTSTGTATEPEPIKPWKQVAEESNIFSLPAEQRVAEYDKWSQKAVAKGIRDGDFDSPDTFSQFKLLDIRTRKNLASDDIVGPSDDDVLADYNSFSTAFQNTQQAFSSQKPTPEDNAIQGEVLQGKRNAAFVRGQMVFNPTIVNDPQKYREAILESDAPPDIKMLYAGLRPEMEKSATVTRRRELANSVITRDVADKVVNAIQEGTEVFGADIGTPQSPALKRNKEGVWSVVDPEYVDMESSMLEAANARYNPLADAQYKPLAAINEYQKKYGLSDEQVQQDYMEALIENAPTAVNRWVSKATSVEDYVKQLDSTVRVKNKDVAPEVRVQDPNLFFDVEGYNAAVDKANAPEEAKNLAKEARTQFADAVAGDIYNNLLANRDDFREDYAKDVAKREDMAKAITRYYKDKKDQAWYDDVGEFIGQGGTALQQGGMNVIMTPSAVLGMFGSVKDAEDVRYATMVQNGQMQAEEAVANRTGGAGAIKLTGDVARILPDLAVQMAIGIMSGGALSFSQAAALSARTGLSKAAARTAIRQAAITGEKAALKTELVKLIPNLSAQAADDVATGALEVAARTMSNNPLKGGIGTQRAIGSAYAGLTSAGSTFGQVYTEVRAMGKSPEESIGIARTAGITAGAITGALTHAFGVLGRGGVEDFASMGRKAGEFTIRDIMKSGVYDVLTTQEGRQLARSIASGIAKDALHEGVEEGLDQALNLISQYATNPSPEAQNRKVSEVINESLYATLLGGIAGGGANVVGQARVTAPGITAQQMQAEIIGANAPQAGAPPESVAPSVAPAPEPIPAPAPVVQSADPVVQQAAETAKAIADVPDTSQTGAALKALVKIVETELPRPESNLPVVEKAPKPVAPVEPAAPANAEEVPVEQPVEPATVEPTAEQPTEEMKTTEETPTARDATKPEQMTPEKGDEVFVKGGDDRITRRIDNIFTAEGKQMVLLQGLQDPIPLDEVVVDPKSDYRKRKQRKAEQTARMVAANPQLIRQLGDLAVRDKQPVSQDYINATGGGIPEGYVKEGELYVFKGEEAPTARDATKPEQMTPEEWLDFESDPQKAALLAADGLRQAIAENKPFNTKTFKRLFSSSSPEWQSMSARWKENLDTGLTELRPESELGFTPSSQLSEDQYLSKNMPLGGWNFRSGGVRGKTKTQGRADYANFIKIALKERSSVNASGVDKLKIPLPKGYVKEGELYVFKGEEAPTARDATKPEQKAEAPAEEAVTKISQQPPEKSGLGAGAATTPEAEPLKVTTPAVEKHLQSFDYLTSNNRDFDIQALELSREDVADAASFIPSHFNAGSAASYGWMYGWKEGRNGRRNPGDRDMGGGVQNAILQGNQAYDKEFGISENPNEPDYIEKGIKPKRVEAKPTGDAVESEQKAEKPASSTPVLKEYPELELKFEREIYPSGKKGGWIIREARSGARAATGKTKEDALDVLRRTLLWQQAWNKKHPSVFEVANKVIKDYKINAKPYAQNYKVKPSKAEWKEILEQRLAEQKEELEGAFNQARVIGGIPNIAFTSEFISEIEQRLKDIDSYKEPKTTKPNAVQEPKPDEGVLRQEGQSVGLPEVDQGGRGAEQESAKQAEEVKGEELTDIEKKALAITKLKGAEPRADGMTFIPDKLMTPARRQSLKTEKELRQMSDPRGGNLIEIKRFGETIGDPSQSGWLIIDRRVTRAGRKAPVEEQPATESELTPQQQDVVVFMDEQNEEQEERQKPKKKRITPGEARKAGTVEILNRLGIQSNNPESVIGALEKIAASKDAPKHHIRIAKDLLSVLEGSGTSIVLVASNDPRIKKGDERVNGWYDPATNTAYINLDGPHELGIEETILHELVHASGEKVIRNPQTEAQKRILGDLQKQMEAATKNAISLGQSVLKTKETNLEKLIALAKNENNYALFDILYGVSSLSEYHAHATTSKAFQRFLSEYKEGSKRNFFERFVNSLTRLLSGQKTAEGSDAEKSYATLLDLMRENKGDVRLSNTDVVQSRARGTVMTEMDSAFADAYAKGDAEAAQAMVDAAAAAANYDTSLPLVHHTFRDFTVFKMGGYKQPYSDAGWSGKGVWMEPEKLYLAKKAQGKRPNIAHTHEHESKLAKEKYAETGRRMKTLRLYAKMLNPVGIYGASGTDFAQEQRDEYGFNRSFPFIITDKDLEILKAKRKDAAFTADENGNIEEVIVFNPSQIKSADPFTFDDAGKLIPLSQRFQSASQDIRFSRARGVESDSAHTELERRFKAGDKDAEQEAKALVEETAKQTGWTEKAYHGTPGGGFTVFDIYGSRYGLMGQGAYFTNAKDVAQSYAEKQKRNVNPSSQTPMVYEVFLKPGRVLDMEAPVDTQLWLDAFGDYLTEDSLSEAKTNEDAFRALEEVLTDEGVSMSEGSEIVSDGLMSRFDSVTHIGGKRMGKGENLHNVTIVFNSEQIKSADAFTYDDDGNLIPLSERFTEQSPDIRFSKARGIVSDAVVKFAPQFNVVDAPDGPSVEFDGRSVTVNPEKLANLEEYEVQDLANRAVVAAIATPKDPITAGIIQQTMDVAAYNFDSESRKGIRKGLADAHRTAHEFGMAPLAMDLGNRLFEFGGATDADVRKSMAKDVSFGRRATYDASSDIKRYSLPRGGEIVGPTTFSIKAYHGTPHKVDKFSLEKIGTGEGVQAYGWGLYFAEALGIAEWYRDSLTQKAVLDKALKNPRVVAARQVIAAAEGVPEVTPTGPPSKGWGTLPSFTADEQKAADSRLGAITQARADYSRILDEAFAEEAKKTGNLYTVELLANEEDFLDWDAPLSGDIVERIDAAVRKNGAADVIARWEDFSRRNTNDEGAMPGITGSAFYGIVASWVAPLPWEFSENKNKQASEFLASGGIPGIRYLDGMSRKAGDGSRNYVIFDDKLIKILEENGTPVPQSRARGTELVTRVSGPALAWKKFISGFRSRGMVSQETYDAYRDSDAFKKENAAFVSFIAKDFTNVTNKLFGEGGANLENFRVFSRDATTGEATVSSRSFDTRQKAEAFAVTNRYKDYVVSTGQDLINQALGSNGPTLKEDVRDAIEKLTKKGLDDIAKSIEAYKEEYLVYWNLVVLETQADMIDEKQIATLRERKEQWMAALRLRSEEQKKLVDDARKAAVQAALADAKNRIVQQQQFAKAYLPDDLVHQIERARKKIDELSTRLTGIKWLMEGSENQMIIEGLNGVYVTRSYEAFETSDKAKYVAWLNEAYSALTNRDQVYDPIAMERIMPLVRHIKNGVMERRIEDLKKENDQRQVDAIMEDLMADSRQVTQVDRVPGQPIEGTEYEKFIQAVAKRDLLRRRSDEKEKFLSDMFDYLARNGFSSNIGDRRKRETAIRKEAKRLYSERYGDAEQQIIADMFGRPEGLQWAVMTDDEAHDIANVERALSESPANLNGSEIWRSDLSGETHSSFYAAVNAEFKSHLDYIAKAPFSKTGANAQTTENWRRLNDKILEHKSDIPAFLRTLWGEKDNPLLRVSDTILKQSNLVAVGNLYKEIAKIGTREGWLIKGPMQATDAKYTDWVSVLGTKDNDQGYRTNPLADKVTDPVMAKAISTLLAANQPSNSAFKVIALVVGVSLWNVTAGSVRAIVRNLSALPNFLMNSGILGAIIDPRRWPVVAKNIVLASRMVQQSMEATGKVSGGKQINNKAFKLVDWFWTKIILSGAAVQRPALYAMKGAATMAEFASRMTEKPTAEQSQEMYLKAVRLGVANDNVQKEAIHRLLDIEEQAIRKPKDKNMGRLAKALKLEGAVGFGSYLLGTTKTALQQRSQLYGAPDDFTKILAWLNEMDAQARINSKDEDQYNEWRGKDGLFSEMPDGFVKKAADNVTNLIQSHSRVWAHVTQFKKMGFGALMAPFAAAKAEFYRNAANAYIIAFEEMRSDNPKEQTNGWMRLASALTAHLVIGNAIGAVVKTIFSAFADDDEIVEGSPEYREAVRKLGPEYAKNKNATYILYKNGTFDWVDLSYANPFAFVWDSITAARRGATEKDVEDNIVVAMSKEILEENIGTFAKPQIALDAFATIRTGYDPVRGVKIWDSQADSFTDKLEKSVSYYLKQAGLPGDFKDGWKIVKAARGVEENGRKYKLGTEVGAVFLGTSIRTVNITDALEQKLAQAKDTLGTRITPLYKAPLRNANDVEMEDVALAVQQYAKAHDQAVSAMQKSYKAAETLLRETPNAKTLLRNVMSSDRVRMSQSTERSIVTGKPSFPEFSDQTLQKMGDLGKKHDDPRLKVAVDTLKEYNQKKKNP